MLVSLSLLFVTLIFFALFTIFLILFDINLLALFMTRGKSSTGLSDIRKLSGSRSWRADPGGRWEGMKVVGIWTEGPSAIRALQISDIFCNSSVFF